MNKITEKIKTLLKGQKFGKDSLLILILAGLLLLVIAWPTDSSDKKKEKESVKYQQLDRESDTLDTSAEEGAETDYERELEERLERLLREMDGVGAVRVMITFSASGEEIPLKDVVKADTDTTEADGGGGVRVINESALEEETIYVTDEAGRRTPFIVRTTKPEVIGVAVIAEGGGNPEIQKNITAVIQSLFRIDANRIIVTKMKG
ncbi:MAG: stage III sporulation protein AG [Clostridium sp.]|nr:stage III sporulation protein AG [Clostridium sp.]